MNMPTLRQATSTDLDFLVEVELKDEGCSSTYMDNWGPEDIAQHRDKTAAFIHDSDKAAWVYEDTTTNRLIAVILWRFRNRLHENFEGWSVINQLDESLFPQDGAFCEIFQLWVNPKYRRQGLASRLKHQAEVESLRRGVKLLYTHTEECNTHVIEMNRKLGYIEVRRGPIWDEIVRVSLIKPLR
ncbi:MAG: GNAT family N-acetyltransferase [Armatimonadota bacterium]|nr:GNAT family N-acetyltransferase [Armatimonadota bacterium]